MVSTAIVAKGAKVDIKNSGTTSIINETVRNNIQGVSKFMEKKGWVDSQGQKGKVTSSKAFASAPGLYVLLARAMQP